jgi:(2Fe-2S) ferredoxin
LESSKPAFQKHLFVCENEREAGACCNPLGAKLRERLKAMVKERGLARTIRVSRTGCLDVCQEGPNVLLMPDNVWFKRVSETDLEEILRVAQDR